ncbi:hypothetical protein K505DRAFT_357751, partial [Melanomma pulvis-pyrius CBS 109.77]
MENCCTIRLEQVHLPELLEEYGRTMIWGDQTKADLPAGARGSLDDTLRHDDELKHLVQAILMRLRALLQYPSPKGSMIPMRDRITIRSAVLAPTRIRIRMIIANTNVRGSQRSVYKYIRSINSKPNTATLSDSDTLPLDVAFSSSDKSHIVEKVLQWRGLTKSGWCVEFEDEDVAPEGQSLTSDLVEDILWFCHRLARANTRRREQLQYWTDNPYDPKQDATNAARPATPDTAQVPAEQEIQELLSQETTLNPPDPILPREWPRSTAIGQGRSNYVPDPLKAVHENTTFPCPYCGMTLESSEMQNRQLWKHHVFRDLRPYVCTFENCQNAEKLYVSRHDWIYHEFQIHRREYACKECHTIHFNREEMSTHLQEHYGKSVLPTQSGVILDLCGRQVDVSDNEKDSCLLCGDELSLSELQGHLANHMEDIALFVLPNADEEEETKLSNVSVQVAKLESEDRTRDTTSKASSLGFSVAGIYGQTPAQFVNIITSEEVGYASKFSSWKTTDDDQMSASSTRTPSDSEEDGTAELEVSYAAQTGNEAKYSDGQMTLLQAAANGHMQMVKLLLDKGTDVNAQGGRFGSALQAASAGGYEQVVKLLLSKGAD